MCRQRLPSAKEFMNKKTADDKVKEVKGSLKEALGKVMGNQGLEAEGAIQKEKAAHSGRDDEAGKPGHGAQSGSRVAGKSSN